MSTRKSSNRANTDSPVSVDSTSTRSSTRSSLQITVGGNSEHDVNITDPSVQESKRPRRTNVRTPTTPTSSNSTNSNKKKSDEIDETSSIPGADTEDDKNLKSSIEEIKSEDDKKTECLTESPARASRKRKVFDKTAIVTRKSAAMDLANNAKRVLRCDRRNSTGKVESVENELKKRQVKKSLSSTPEPSPTSALKRKRMNSVRPEEEIKRSDKFLKLELAEERTEDEILKDSDLAEIVGIKQEIDEDITDVPLTGSISKEIEEELEPANMKKGIDNVDEEKLSDKICNDEDLSDGDQKQIENTEMESTNNDKKALSKNDNKVEVVPEKPRRGRPKKLVDPTISPAKKVGRRSIAAVNKDLDKKTRLNKKVAQKICTEPIESTETDDLEKSNLNENIEIKSKNIISENELLHSVVEEPLVVDTAASCMIAASENTSPSTSSDKNSAKAASLSPELISEGVSVISVKQFYKKPEFLENNLGIEKDPKLGEIVQEVENTKTKIESSNSSETVIAAAVKTDEVVAATGSNSNCRGDSLKEEERLVLDVSTEDETSRSTCKLGNDDASEDVICTTEVCSEELDLARLEVENKSNEDKKEVVEKDMYEKQIQNRDEPKNEEEQIESNSIPVENVLQSNCDNIGRNTAVDVNEEESGVYESDIELNDKIACNKNSHEEVTQDQESKQISFGEDDLQTIVNEKTDSGSIEKELKDINQTGFKALIKVHSEQYLKIGETNMDSENLNEDNDKTEELMTNSQESIETDEDGSIENKENSVVEDVNGDNAATSQSITNLPKMIEDDDEEEDEEEEEEIDKNDKKLLETPETFKQKENHLKHLGLLTHKAAVEAKIEKQRRRKLLQNNLLDNGGGNNGNNKKTINNISETSNGANVSANETCRSNGSTIGAGSCNKDTQEYTGTLKTVIKLNRQASNGSVNINNENKRNKAAANINNSGNSSINTGGRQSLKITFQKGRGKSGNSSDKDQSNSANSGDDTYYTIQNETEGIQQQETITHGRKSYNRYHTTGVCTFYITKSFSL